MNIDYILYGNLLRDVRVYIGVLNFTANIPANHENASGVSADPHVQGLVDHIHDLTRKDFLTRAAPSSGSASPVEPLTGAEGEPLSGGAPPPSGGGASPKSGGRLPAPVSATARRGTDMRNNRICRPNVVTRLAAGELRCAVPRYRDVRPNNNNINHAALVKRFQPSTPHELR